MITLPNGALYDPSKRYFQQSKECQEWGWSVINDDSKRIERLTEGDGLRVRPTKDTYISDGLTLVVQHIYVDGSLNQSNFMAHSDYILTLIENG